MYFRDAIESVNDQNMGHCLSAVTSIWRVPGFKLVLSVNFKDHFYVFFIILV